MKTRTLPFAIATLWLACAGPSGASDGTEGAAAGEADVAAGEALYQGGCRNCHGPTAKGMASFPKLVGHDAGYLTGRLEQYRSGEQVGPNTALMKPQAVNLSDEDIANLAAYLVSLGG